MIIGITGGIGSGKSTIARALAARGYAVYDCDKEAKRIISENKAVQQQIIALLGPEAFVNGVYNTSYVAQRVFAEPRSPRRQSRHHTPFTIKRLCRVTINQSTIPLPRIRHSL